MSEEYAVLSGEIENWPCKDEMCRILETANLSLNVGEYAIRIKGFDHFVFREFGGDMNSPCITAETESADELIRQSHIVSQALSAAGLKHRFEVYDGNDELVAYHHFNWPKDW
ncbi:hypothetical protein [Litoribrevibacter albus]|nr:hypothetical protein [Litoribrevibacter albus]